MNSCLSKLLISAALALLAFPLDAQDLRFSGKVEDGESICYYCPGFGFVLDNTHTSLTSTTINLAPFIGSFVTGTAQWDGSTVTPALTVTSITVVPQSFSIGGNSSIGNKMNFSVFATPGDTALIALALEDGFIPVGGQDIAFLSPASLLILGSGTVGGGGEFNIKFNLPNNPALIGLNVFAQAAVFHPDGTRTLTNSDLKVIS